jgi:hypothetical protein
VRALRLVQGLGQAGVQLAQGRAQARVPQPLEPEAAQVLVRELWRKLPAAQQ